MENETRPLPSADPSLSDARSEILDVPSDQVQSIINECIRRRKAGESLTDEEVLAAHPDPQLQVELRQALSHLRMIERAFAKADPGGTSRAHATDDGVSKPARWDGSHDASATCLRVRCPHCFTPSNRIPDTPWEEIVCAKCGNSFRLAGVELEAVNRRIPRSIGHFDLIEQIGIGGFGTVWKAHYRELDRMVAIEVPRRGQLTPDETEQCFREARVTLPHSEAIRKQHDVFRVDFRRLRRS